MGRHHLHSVNHEGVIGHDRFVAGRQEGSRQQTENFIGTVAENDVVRRDLPPIGQRFTQAERPAIRVPVQRGSSLVQHGQRLGRRAQRIFVRGQLDDPGEAHLTLQFFDRLARHVRAQGGDIWVNMQCHGVNCGPDRTRALS